MAVKTLKHDFKIKRIALAGLLAVILIFSATSCLKNNAYKWVYYDETQCSDPWEYNINNEKLKDNVTNYLKGKDITIYDIEIFSDIPAETNTSCSSKTGRRFKCKLKKSKVDNIKLEGFYEK